MVNSVAGSPKDEAKEMFLQVQEGESFLFEYFFESYRPPDHISKEDYMKELSLFHALAVALAVCTSSLKGRKGLQR